MFEADETLQLADEGLKQAVRVRDCGVENPEYLTRQLITYIGNKRALLGHITGAVERVKERLGKRRLRVFDAFSGSGIVSRLFKSHAELVISNDLEPYAAAISRCFLSNRSEVDLGALSGIAAELNDRVEDAPYPRGFIEELYSPDDESCVSRRRTVSSTRRATPGGSTTTGACWTS